MQGGLQCNGRLTFDGQAGTFQFALGNGAPPAAAPQGVELLLPAPAVQEMRDEVAGEQWLVHVSKATATD
eukprot:6568186-Pyramimonas_sp.AAC.1